MFLLCNSYINQLLTLYNFSLLYQISSSSCSEFGTGPSRCRSSLDLDKIFRRETISPLLGPQLKYKIMIELLYIQITFTLRTEIMSTGWWLWNYAKDSIKHNCQNGVKKKVIIYSTRWGMDHYFVIKSYQATSRMSTRCLSIAAFYHMPWEQVCMTLFFPVKNNWLGKCLYRLIIWYKAIHASISQFQLQN